MSSGLPNGQSQAFNPATVVVASSSAAGDMIKSGPTASADLKGGVPSEDVVATLGLNAPQPLRPASPSDSVVVPSLHSHGLAYIGASRQDIGSNKTSVVEHKVGRDVPIDNKGMLEFT